MTKMTQDEMLRYRSDGIPDEILYFMSHIFSVAKDIELKKLAGEHFDTTKLLEDFDYLEKRISFYYQKRIKDFGIRNMRLKRLLDSIPELKANLGLL